MATVSFVKQHRQLKSAVSTQSSRAGLDFHMDPSRLTLTALQVFYQHRYLTQCLHNMMDADALERQRERERGERGSVMGGDTVYMGIQFGTH